MNTLQTEWWTLDVPPEWWAEHDEDVVVIGDRDDVGCIEISTLQHESGRFTDEEVAGIARANAESEMAWQAARLGAFRGVTARYREEDSAVREWYVASDGLLLFITYSCAAENEGLDDAPVDDILGTLARLS